MDSAAAENTAPHRDDLFVRHRPRDGDRQSHAHERRGLPGTGRYPGARPLGSPGLWNPCCTCAFSSLPDALLQDIFSYLARPDLLNAGAVCTRWNYIAESPSLWRHVAVPSPTTGVGLARLLTRERPEAVQSLSLRRLVLQTPAQLQALQSLAFPRLSELDLRGCRAADPGALVDLAVRCGTTLRVLALDGVTCLTDAHVARILQAAPGLRGLSLSSCRQLTDATLGALAGAPCIARLTALDVSSCTGMTAAALARVVAATAAAAAAAAASGGACSGGGVVFGRLREVRARGILRPCDGLLHALAASAPLLSCLDIGYANPWGTAGASPSAGASSRGGASSGGLPVGAGAGASAGSSTYTPLDAASPGTPPCCCCIGSGEERSSPHHHHYHPSHAVSDAGLNALTDACRGLTELRLQGHGRLTDAGLGASLGHLPHLRVLDLAGCKGAGEATFAALCSGSSSSSGGGASAASQGSHGRHGRSHDGSVGGPVAATGAADAAGPAAPPSHLPPSSAHGSAGGLVRAGTPRRAPLAVLRLFGVTGLQDAHLLALARSLPCLVELDLYGCRQLSAHGVEGALQALAASGTLRTAWLGGIPSLRQALATTATTQQQLLQPPPCPGGRSNDLDAHSTSGRARFPSWEPPPAIDLRLC